MIPGILADCIGRKIEESVSKESLYVCLHAQHTLLRFVRLNLVRRDAAPESPRLEDRIPFNKRRACGNKIVLFQPVNYLRNTKGMGLRHLHGEMRNHTDEARSNDTKRREEGREGVHPDERKALLFARFG